VETATSSRSVIGFEILCQAPFEGATLAWLYRANSSKVPTGSPVATTTLEFGKGTSWCRALFSTTTTFPAGTNYALAFLNPATGGSIKPLVSSGTRGTHCWRSASATSFSGPFTTQRWAYRVLCSPASHRCAPALSNTLLPKLGKTFRVNLDFARPATPAILFLGISNTKVAGLGLPLHLNFLGATGCSLLVSPDFNFVQATSGNGAGSVSFPVPRMAILDGVHLYFQWLVRDPGANAMGWVFSNGGDALFGN
jgi:hypothetical protein